MNKMRGKPKVKKRDLKRASRLEDLSAKMQLPYDTMVDAIVLTAYDAHCVKIENYQAIIDYTDEVVQIASKSNCVRIEGSGLQLSYCFEEEICVIGRIKQIRYLQ